MNYLPFIIFAVVVIGMLAFAKRARNRQAAATQQQVESIAVGTEVMTTSGLYGTVVVLNDDSESVQMSIAPGVEVKWAIAALRDVASLPARYAVHDDSDDSDDPDDSAVQDAIEAPGVDLDKADHDRADHDRADRNRADRNRADRNRADRNRADRNRADRNRADRNRGDQRRRGDSPA